MLMLTDMHAVNESTAQLETLAIMGLGTISTLTFVIRVAVIEIIGMIAEIQKARIERRKN